MQDEDVAGKAYDARLVRRLSEYVWPYGWLVASAVACLMLADSDEIPVLHHGQVRERGSHRALLANHGLYARLYRLQSGAAEPPTQSIGSPSGV